MKIYPAKNIQFGIVSIKPIHEQPSGKIKIKMRPYDFVKVYIRNESGTTGYHVEEIDNEWHLVYPIGVNYKPKGDQYNDGLQR
jgi:hypothetical protein